MHILNLQADCGPPDAMLHADVSAQSTLQEDIATYTCHPGYLLTMDDTDVITLECQPDATWSSPTDTCQGKFEITDIKSAVISITL